MPTALVITAAGINCDRELLEAFRLAGCTAEPILLHRLIEEPALLEEADLIGLPGGFSYGDDIAAGRVMATLIRQRLHGPLARAIERGTPMIAPCNGFQIAVQAGLLPGPGDGGAWPTAPAVPTVALAENAAGRFVDRWTTVEVPVGTRCVWTRGLESEPETRMLPVAHGEGRFVTEPDHLAALDAAGQVALRYAAGENPNGSMGDVAGICDASGLVFGLMPHPERSLHWTQHPFWTRLSDGQMEGEPFGLRLFRQAVAHSTGVASA